MKRLLAVAYLEARPRAGLLVVALALGMVPTALALAAPDALDATQAAQAVFVLAALLPPIAALLLGASMLGRDLAERRLSFYLTRPLSLTTTWAGKVLGTAALLLLSAAAVTLPAGLAGIGVEVPDLEPLPGLGLGRLFMTVAIASFFLLMLSHVVATCLRGPALAVAAALGAGTAVAAALIRIMGRLLDDRAYEDAARIALAFAVAASAVLLAAAGVHLHRSRVEPRRAHLPLALLTWGGLGACVLAAAVAARAALDVTPGEIRVTGVAAPPAGTWVAVRGVDADRSEIAVGLLLDTASGRWHRGWRRNAGLGSVLPEPVELFASSGRFFAWSSEGALDAYRLEERPVALDVPRPLARPGVALTAEGGLAWVAHRDGRARVRVMPLRGARAAECAIESTREPARFLDASDDGVVLALTGRDLVIQACRAGDVVTLARVPGASGLRVSVSEATRRVVIDPLAHAERIARSPGWAQTPSGRRAGPGAATRAPPLAVLDLESGSVDWLELPDAAEIAGRLGPLARPPSGPWSCLPLADGRILLLERARSDAFAVILGSDGSLVRVGQVAGASVGEIAGECAPGRVLVSVHERVAVLDVDALALAPLGTARLASPLPSASHLVVRAPRPGEGGSRLVITPEGALMRLDPTTMTLRRIAGVP